MSTDEKISKWITKMEEEGKTRDDIARGGAFVKRNQDGTFSIYTLSKSGKTKYNLKIHIGALDLDQMED